MGHSRTRQDERVGSLVSLVTYRHSLFNLSCLSRDLRLIYGQLLPHKENSVNFDSIIGHYLNDVPHH
jgi:hypothetical protein